MKKLLVVGGTGFVGSHVRQMSEKTFSVIATGLDVDVRDLKKLCTLIEKVQPDEVLHLAAITTLRESFENPGTTYDINFLGTLNLLTALRETEFTGRVLFVSSSEVYGLLGENDLPVTESRQTKPLSPYAVSKIAAEALCYQWNQTENFEIIVARPFNHIGPGQNERFAIADFGRQVAAIKLGLKEPVIHVGDIETTRDFTDVRDIVSAYRLLFDHGHGGDIYNVCSGIECSIRSLVERLCQLAGVSVELRADSERFRSSEQRRVCGDNRKLVEATGWVPAFSMDQTLIDILDFWVRKKNDNVQ
ncbi:MAG: GDP-mannose 4,6-dehydratase [Desulfamplus sp.]|nr:GDP-mannose 4,6-dehydratase [Desulfamplus sp.]